MSMAMNFRTSMFGGFDKEDVVRFIEKSSKESQEALAALQEENQKLQADAVRMEDALRTLHAQLTKQAQDGDELDALRCRLAACEGKAEVLQKENDALRGPAAEYEELKAHIADIEISAHRRTEEFRAVTIAQIKEILHRQGEWCTRQKQAYADTNAALLQSLRRAERELELAQSSSFDSMLESLQQLEDGLDK